MILGLIVGAMAVGSGATAFADSTDTNTGATASNGQASASQDINKSNRGKGMDFSAFVTKGIIDQATADKMTAYQKEHEADRKAEREKIKAMTETERDAYFKENPKNGPMSDMVTAGIITQAQADAMKAAMPEGGKNHGGKGPMDFSNLVSQGVIDQATADKITAYEAEHEADRKAEMDKVKAMTDAERDAYFKENPKTGPMERLVTAGVITQAQADAIKAAMPTHDRGPK